MATLIISAKSSDIDPEPLVCGRPIADMQPIDHSGLRLAAVGCRQWPTFSPAPRRRYNR
ncbi:hypothetical protein REMIM1_PF00178 (plasmid) [Rhizobium etli bv. mimosae str. Mim1]|nr:hypothetical protein REMIM1_PF00178 [Rhizobium etli bv. mimosae str. Mim1]